MYSLNKTVMIILVEAFALNNEKYKSEFIPEFKKNYLSPVYWSTWFLLGMIAGISMFPPSFRDPVLAKIGRWAGRLSKKLVAGRRLIYRFVSQKRVIQNGK